MRYRIKWQRWDTQARIYEFDANSDEEAKVLFEKRFVNNENYDWEWLDLYRVDVVEKITIIGYRNDRQDGVQYPAKWEPSKV